MTDAWMGLLVAEAVCLASCELRPRTYPVDWFSTCLIRQTRSPRLTSLPLCTHLRQGLALSHRRCFFLQLIHADAT
jgi:hypothetical protein